MAKEMGRCIQHMEDYQGSLLTLPTHDNILMKARTQGMLMKKKASQIIIKNIQLDIFM